MIINPKTAHLHWASMGDVLFPLFVNLYRLNCERVQIFLFDAVTSLWLTSLDSEFNKASKASIRFL